jgi:hypothetical protein
VQVFEGEGWRLRLDPDRSHHPVLIGGSDWAAEFSWSEARELGDLAAALVHEWEALVDRLMPEETLVLELERELGPGSLWMELAGDCRRWSLRFVLSPEPARRGLEAGWGPGAAQAFCTALRSLDLRASAGPGPPPG